MPKRHRRAQGCPSWHFKPRHIALGRVMGRFTAGELHHALRRAKAQARQRIHNHPQPVGPCQSVVPLAGCVAVHGAQKAFHIRPAQRLLHLCGQRQGLRRAPLRQHARMHHQPAMALQRHGWLMVHAGVLPQWSVAQTLMLAAEVEQALRGPDVKGFLSAMYGNAPGQWHDALTGADRLRVIVNALTRLRFCTPQGVMEFTSSEAAHNAPEGYMPWFEVPGRATLGTPMAFGHWSTLAIDAKRVTGLRHNALPLDTGCVWGGCLSAARLGAEAGEFELITVKCEQAQKPA